MAYRYTIHLSGWTLTITSFAAVATIIFSVLMPSAGIDWSEPWRAPVLPAPVEASLQGALHRTAPAPSADPTLKHRLEAISIRAALEDTERLHNDRG